MLCLAALLLPSVLAAAGTGDPTVAPGFIDITRSSGLEDLQEHY